MAIWFHLTFANVVVVVVVDVVSVGSPQPRVRFEICRNARVRNVRRKKNHELLMEFILESAREANNQSSCQWTWRG